MSAAHEIPVRSGWILVHRVDEGWADGVRCTRCDYMLLGGDDVLYTLIPNRPDPIRRYCHVSCHQEYCKGCSLCV